jgi:hypothetical protein
MTVENFITFVADFPDDSSWDALGRPLVPAGNNIMAHLAAELNARGLRASQPTQYKFYGWAFEIDHCGTIVWCLLQYAEKWLLIVEARRSLIRRFLHKANDIVWEEVIAIIKSVLIADERFSDVISQSRRQFETKTI